MGANSQSKKTTQETPKFNRLNYEITVSKVIHFVQLNRDRKIAELQKLDAQLLQMFTTKQLNAESMKDIGQQCVNLFKFIKGTNTVLRDLKVLADQSLAIEASVKNREPVSSTFANDSFCSLVN